MALNAATLEAPSAATIAIVYFDIMVKSVWPRPLGRRKGHSMFEVSIRIVRFRQVWGNAIRFPAGRSSRPSSFLNRLFFGSSACVCVFEMFPSKEDSFDDVMRCG